MQKTIKVGDTEAYHSYPEDGQKHPGLILIEEIWGVDAHIKSVADRFAAAGFSVLAPELLPAGMLEIMTPQLKSDLFDPEKRSEVQPTLRAAMAPIMQPEYAEGAIALLKSCIDYLLADSHVSGEIGVVGFCFGGSYSFHLVANDSRISAAIAFYGQAPTEEEIQNITCPMLALYGDQDTHLIETLPQLKTAMEKWNKSFEAVVYPGVGHAFFNDTNPRTYNASVAEDAWGKTLAFLGQHLR